MVVHRVAPVYPPEAKRARIQGTVVLAAVIGKDGRIKGLNVISGPSMLVDAAVGAVQQWRYRPYVLQGEPVEVDTTITVNFNLR
jgi:protein TonB